MREILFRAKRIDNGKWVEGYYIYHIRRTICPIGDSVKPEDEQHVIMHDGFSDWNMPRDTVFFNIDPETLCQYTGLKDKNGNRVWENDVIKYHFADIYAPIKYGVYQSSFDSTKTEHIGFYTEWTGMDGNILRKDLGYWVNMAEDEIVGNIFDNPELLKRVETAEKERGDGETDSV